MLPVKSKLKNDLIFLCFLIIRMISLGNGGSIFCLQYSFWCQIMEDKIRTYLAAPHLNPRPPNDEQPHFLYLLAYLGELFIQGYRIIQTYDQLLLLSYMQFQPQTTLSRLKRKQRKIPVRFKVLAWLMSSKGISDSAKVRKQLYLKMLDIGTQLDQVEYDLVYIQDRKYTVMGQKLLQINQIPSCAHYFTKINWIAVKNGHKVISDKEEGIQLHLLVESYIKGAGQARSPALIKKMQTHIRYTYDLFNVINTVSYVIGKEILENDYQTISVEKWMRKFTQKKFKRFDLLMRNEDKCSILDWKFSRLDAAEKIRGASSQRKNQQYYQLARKDFKTDVQLKFYCFHQRKVHNVYHACSCASFQYKIQTVDIDTQAKIDNLLALRDSLRRQQIDLDDSIVEAIPNVHGQAHQNAKMPEVIALESQAEEQVELPADQRQTSQPASPAQIEASSYLKIIQEVNEAQVTYIEPERVQMTNKLKIKQAKIQSKFFMPPAGCPVYQIQSD